MNADREAFERTVRFSNLGANDPVATWPPRRKPRKPFRFSPRLVIVLFAIGYLLGLLLPKFI